MPKQQEHICTVARIRQLERAIFKKNDSFSVMRRAADHIASTCQFLPDPLVFVAGSGNNGGDATVAASVLRAKGRDVRLWFPLGLPKVGTDAAKALRMWHQEGGSVEAANFNPNIAGAIVDGLFGIGLNRKLATKPARIIAKINSVAKPVLAIDVPSGVCADSGTVKGAAVKATTTVTIIALKPGLLMEHGRHLAGEVQVAPLGYPLEFGATDGTTCSGVQGIEPLVRSGANHKGSFGSLAVIGGADGMLGALVLASRAATAHGAGKVFAIALGEGLKVDVNCPEVMWRSRPTSGHTALATGVGLGNNENAIAAVGATLGSPKPAVLDADALNLLATSASLRKLLVERKAATVLSPHPGEAARLLGISPAKLQAERLANAQRLARKFRCTILLKGAGSVIASVAGWQIVTAGNAALAQAGSGDILTGIIGALLAQGMDAHSAAATAAWVHGTGAQLATEEHGGKLGVPLEKIMIYSSKILAWQVAAISS